jgi:hypothetical protein
MDLQCTAAPRSRTIRSPCQRDIFEAHESHLFAVLGRQMKLLKERFQKRDGHAALGLHRGEVTQEISELYDCVLAGLPQDGIGAARSNKLQLLLGAYARGYEIFNYDGPLTESLLDEMPWCYEIANEYLAAFGLQKSEVDASALGPKCHSVHVRNIPVLFLLLI